MINLLLENKCNVLDCDEEYTLIFNNIKYCNKHVPDNSFDVVKRLCKYCDIKENVSFICTQRLRVKKYKIKKNGLL